MPAPAPKSISEPHIGVPRRGAGRLHGASFDQLLRELQWRHDEEVVLGSVEFWGWGGVGLPDDAG